MGPPNLKRSPDSQPLLRPPKDFELQEYGVSSTNEVDETQRHPETHSRTIGVFDGIALTIGAQVGTGIYWAPASVIRATGGATSALACWLAAGILSWAGADTLASLGTIVSLNGGIMEYIRICFGDTFGFVTAWALILVIQPSVTALLSLICSRQLVWLFGSWYTLESWVMRLFSCFIAALITFVSCSGIRSSKRAARLFLLVKLLGLLSIILIGFGLRLKHGHPVVLPDRDAKENTVAALADAEDAGKRTWLGEQMHADARALFTAFWVFSGWDTLSYLGGEISESRRTIPRIYNLSQPLVIFLDVMAIAAFIAALGTEQLSHTWRAASELGEAAFGDWGKTYFGLIVCLSGMGVLNVKILAGGRLTQAAAERDYMPSFLASAFARIDGLGQSAFRKGGETPRGAMIFNLLLTCLSMFSGYLWKVVGVSGFVEQCSLLAIVVGLIWLVYGPQSARPEHSSEHYRPFLLSLPIFTLVAISLVARGMYYEPKRNLLMLGTLAMLAFGYKARLLWQKRQLGNMNAHAG